MSEPSPTPDSHGSDPALELPATVDAAVQRLFAVLPDKAKAEIAAKGQDQLIKLHFGLGNWIRENFALWQGNAALAQDASCPYPDDVAGVIINALWRHLRASEQRDIPTIVVDPDDGGTQAGVLLPPPPGFRPKPIRERLDEPIDPKGDCRVLHGKPYILYGNADYAQDWSGEFVREVHPFILIGAPSITIAEFWARVRAIEAEGQCRK